VQDGKHIRIQCPPSAGSTYDNFKNFHSIVLQAVADADGKSIAVDVGDYGRISDGSILKESSFNNLKSYKLLVAGGLNLPNHRTLSDESENLPFVSVGDEAYPLMRNMRRPSPRKSLTNEKRINNYRFSRARRIVECASGMLTNKLSVFHDELTTGES
jgi:hypothetical protein